jgi:hypothetical protein
VFLAGATILLPRLDRDELDHPLDHPDAAESDAIDLPSGKGRGQ